MQQHVNTSFKTDCRCHGATYTPPNLATWNLAFAKPKMQQQWPTSKAEPSPSSMLACMHVTTCMHASIYV